jgi:hypothetical protein
MIAQRGSTDIGILFLLTSALDGGWWLTQHPGRFSPGNEPVPIVQNLGGTRGRF